MQHQVMVLKEKYKGAWVNLEELKSLLVSHSFSQTDVETLFTQVDQSKKGKVEFVAFVDFIYGGAHAAKAGAAAEESAESSEHHAKPTEWAEPTTLDRSIVREFMELSQHGKVQAEYVWLDSEYTDGRSFDLCSKALTLDSAPKSVKDLPIWAYSGSDDTDVQLVPRRIYRDPFRRGDNIIVLADTYEEPSMGSGKPHGPPKDFNTRADCDSVMSQAEAMGEDPWFGIEQEYYLLDAKTGWPLGWPEGGYPGKHDCYYCAVGAMKAPGREVVEAHYKACLYAGVKLGGVNSEVAPAQWEFQVGPCTGITGADDLWMARYILQRICELFSVYVTFDPKPMPGWPGIGCHTNYSTMSTRSKPGGMDAIKAQCEKLRLRHMEHMAAYGDGNERRLTGKDSTAHITSFSWGVSDRDASIRISSKCVVNDCGYYEDRRPAANMDPYLVCKMIVETTLLLDGAEKVGDAADAAAGSLSRPCSGVIKAV
mmetsp:Transcript_134592/g.287992  ORF Transcript_134592/g.287992 Transcript_134592/m.287992 type:complete len:482 (-) Transcript_134592:39-1484(-)